MDAITLGLCQKIVRFICEFSGCLSLRFYEDQRYSKVNPKGSEMCQFVFVYLYTFLQKTTWTLTVFIPLSISKYVLFGLCHFKIKLFAWHLTWMECICIPLRHRKFQFLFHFTQWYHEYSTVLVHMKWCFLRVK